MARLPSGWKQSVQSALLNVIALATYSLKQVRGEAGEGEIERLRQDVLLLREQMRIKDARLEQIPPQRRPHYRPTERLAILELRAARN